MSNDHAQKNPIFEQCDEGRGWLFPLIKGECGQVDRAWAFGVRLAIGGAGVRRDGS